jgi:type VI secretion system protein ImpI
MPLSLILEVAGERALELGEARRKVFGDAGGRIGRAPDCDWVLANPYVSRHHATVLCIDGVFHIESVGENGVAVNDAQAMLPQLVRHALIGGDRIFIDEYEISVVVAESAEAAGPGTEAVFTQPPAPRLPASDPLVPVHQDYLDPLKRFLSRTASGSTVPSEEPAWNHSSSLADHFNPPPVPAPTAAIPKGWEKTEGTLSLPRPAQQPQYAGSPAGAAAFDVSAFLLGAGLQPESVPPEMASTLGQIVRSVVQGLMDVLRARAEFRNQFRLPVTRVQMAQNNPLKFAISAEDALLALLRTRARGYLPPLEAFDDAFDDIRFHQLAMLAGMRAGFESLMSRFDPKKLQEQADRRSRGVLASLGAKARYWDWYVDQFEQMAGNADSVFQRLYGEEFSGAYERQLEELKRTRAKASR